MESEIPYFTHVHEEVAGSSVAGDDARNDNGILKMGDVLEVRMDLTDDLLHMVHIEETAISYFLRWLIGS